ncbi:hypothetical protein [Sphingobium sp. YG1]|uniref:hypothetical protein n=1 Tax=Sphingobium sp. YG1 TaxID=2082188 RepID=UPI001E4E4891|nr:hypothetical protein [Sphingobium sp. YG1]
MLKINPIRTPCDRCAPSTPYLPRDVRYPFALSVQIRHFRVVTPITLSEFRVLLEALEIDLIQAIIKVESIRDQKVLADERYVALIAMLANLFKELPASLIQALAEIDGLDGSEVRKDWAPQLQTVVIKRMVHEVTNVLRRREQIFEDRYDLRG